MQQAGRISDKTAFLSGEIIEYNSTEKISVCQKTKELKTILQEDLAK